MSAAAQKQTTIFNFNDIDFSRIIIPALTKKDQRLTSTPLYSDPVSKSNVPLCIQTPIVRAPFGFSKSVSKESGRITYSISGAFDDLSDNTACGKFYKFARKFEEFAIHTAAKNSKSWFNEDYDVAVCRAMLNKWVKKSKSTEKEYPPTFKGTVREKVERDANKQPIVTEKKQFWTTAKDRYGNPIDIDTIQAGDKVVMKLKLTSFYVIANKPGFTWDVEWVMLMEKNAGSVFDYDPTMYDELPAPAIPVEEPVPANPESSGSAESDAPGDATVVEGKRAASEAPEEAPVSNNKRSRKN